MRRLRGIPALLGCPGTLSLALALPLAHAQEQEVQRVLIQRDQQSAGFALQLRQSQEKGRPARGDNRQLNERQRLENLSGQQLLEVKPDPPPAPRAYERQKAADERNFMFPPPTVMAPPPPAPVPLPTRPPAVPGIYVVPEH